MSLSLQHITYMHADKEVLFRDISFSIEAGDKMTLVGHNGSGKSTLLRIMAGRLEPTSGQVVGMADQVYYVPQHFGQYGSQTPAQAMQIDDKLQALHAILRGEVDHLHFDTLNDHWNIEADALAALARWGLEGVPLTETMETLSGGEKTKVFLAGMDLHPHALLLMDEPTNHLDYDSRCRLYDFVTHSRNALLIVSHDRTLLNLVPTTAELTATGIEVFGGNYDFYRRQKDIRQNALQQQLEEKEKQLRLAKKQARETAERQQKHSVRGEKQNIKKGVPRIVLNSLKGASENTAAKLKDVHSEKMENLQSELSEIRRKAATGATLQTDFNSSTLHEGKILIKADGVNVAFDNRVLWPTPLSFEVRSGERLVINGVNGSGKTTLLRLIMGSLQPQTGSIVKADKLEIVYLDQEYSIIKNELSILAQAESFNKLPLPEHEVKTILNRFLFPASVWDKPCSKLSGGEKMRLAFGCLMIANNKPDIFMLDEPTNNLDIQSIEIVTNTIRNYRGTVIVISHDRYFLDEIGVQRRLELERTEG